MAKIAGLISAAPKAKTAGENTISAIKATVNYLGFSGFETKELAASVTKSLAST
jgi:hypothetical protein